MKSSIISPVAVFAFVFGLAASSSPSPFTNSLQDLQNEKAQGWMPSGSPIPPEVLVGGEDIGSAIPIAVGGSSSGTTCDNVDDYDEECPYTGSISGDEVYSIGPGVSGEIAIDLCNSGYDTKVYVYEDTPGNLIACNDDACNDPSGNPYRSRIDCAGLNAGSTYYVVVDGYGGDCGDYNISVSYNPECSPPPAPCEPTDCPPSPFSENEPVCFDGYVDSYNGGCNSEPPVFRNLPCLVYDELVVCGTGGTYISDGLNYRDTDWYAIDLGTFGPCEVTVSLCASFNSQLAIIDGDVGCGDLTLTCGSVFGTAGETVSCGPVAMDGDMWVFVATSDFAGVPCGAPYYLTIDLPCLCDWTATEGVTWGRIKGLYR